ncbi:MAG: class I adenylate-forming enzyme family protein [Pseudomonadota bacterium]
MADGAENRAGMGSGAASGGVRADGWLGRQPVATRKELHFGRVMTCFAERPATLWEMLRDAMARAGDADAIVAEEARLSHAELARQGAQVAAGLSAAGIGRGDRVAIQLINRAAFVELWVACLRLGAVLVPMNPRWTAREIAYSVNDCGAKAVFVEADLADALPGRGAIPSAEVVVSVGDAPLYADQDPEGAPETPTGEEETAVILYTSGTTGNPKGAMLTHLNLVHSVVHFQLGMEVRPGDRTLLSVPASHVTGLVANIAALLSVGGAIIMQRAFKARAFLELAERERATHSLMVPAMYNLCLRDPDIGSMDLSAWRLGGYGGAPMPPATIEAMSKAVPTLALQQAYGSTETTSPATLMPVEETATKPWSVGIPVHCGQIAVMDDAGRELPPGETGEVWIAGPMVVPGYWANPEATAKEFVSGYWKSGDLGRMDETGHLRILDRKKDMINRAGYKVYSVEVENVLARHPDVVEAAVTGYPCEVLGERVRAHVFLREGVGGEAALEALSAHARAELADYKQPDDWRLRDAPLPRNANGKVVKRDLRDG